MAAPVAASLKGFVRVDKMDQRRKRCLEAKNAEKIFENFYKCPLGYGQDRDRPVVLKSVVVYYRSEMAAQVFSTGRRLRCFSYEDSGSV